MLNTYRKWLLGVWIVGFIIPFFLILLQTGSGKYGDKFGEVLGWLTTLTLSTILLMVGVMVSNPISEKAAGADQTDEAQKKEKHEKFVFQIAVGASVVYLLIINLTFFAEPLVSNKPQELMRDSKIYLAVLDSLISLLIGYFFGKT